MANVDAEASYFSDLLHIPEERMNKLPRGHFAMHIRGEDSSIAEVPFARLPYREMTVAEQQAHQKRMTELYGIQKQKAPQTLGEAPSRPASGAAGEAPIISPQPKPAPADEDDHTKPSKSW